MKKNKIITGLLAAAVALTLTACGNKKEATKTNDEVSGSITVVTNRADAKDLYAKIAKDFKAKYPKVKEVKFENTGTDYDKYIANRMNTKNYGDVLFVPFSMAGKPEEYAKYFESLGKVKDMEKDYIDVTEADYKGEVYGLPAVLNSLGYVYNKDVFEKAGIKEMPTTTKQFIADAKTIKEKTGVTPVFSNYQAVAMWVGAMSSFGGENFKQDMLKKGTAFEKGQPLRQILDLIYTLAKEGLIEKDPVSMQFPQGMKAVADGKTAMFMGGSQHVLPVQKMSDKKDNIAIMPFPVKINGKTSLALGAPAVVGINKNSKNKATAKAFLDFFISAKSGFAEDMGGMTPVKADFTKEQEKLVSENNVVLTAPAASAKVEKEYAEITNKVGIGRYNDMIQKVINIALYPDQNPSYDEYLKSMETKWEDAAK